MSDVLNLEVFLLHLEREREGWTEERISAFRSLASQRGLVKTIEGTGPLAIQSSNADDLVKEIERSIHTIPKKALLPPPPKDETSATA